MPDDDGNSTGNGISSGAGGSDQGPVNLNAAEALNLGDVKPVPQEQPVVEAPPVEKEDGQKDSEIDIPEVFFECKNFLSLYKIEAFRKRLDAPDSETDFLAEALERHALAEEVMDYLWKMCMESSLTSGAQLVQQEHLVNANQLHIKGISANIHNICIENFCTLICSSY